VLAVVRELLITGVVGLMEAEPTTYGAKLVSFGPPAMLINPPPFFFELPLPKFYL
jgi:hypothetical protein